MVFISSVVAYLCLELSTTTKTAAETFYGGVKMMDKISKIQINQYNGITFADGTVIKIYGVRA